MVYTDNLMIKDDFYKNFDRVYLIAINLYLSDHSIGEICEILGGDINPQQLNKLILAYQKHKIVELYYSSNPQTNQAFTIKEISYALATSEERVIDRLQEEGLI